MEILCNGILLCIFPNSAISDVTLVDGNRPWRKYLHQRNWQTLQIWALFIPREPIVKHSPVPPWISPRCTFTQASRVPQGDSALVTYMYWVPSCPWPECFLCLLMFPEITFRINLNLRSQLLDKPKLRHCWIPLCGFIKTSGRPLDYSVYPKHLPTPAV